MVETPDSHMLEVQHCSVCLRSAGMYCQHQVAWHYYAGMQAG